MEKPTGTLKSTWSRTIITLKYLGLNGTLWTTQISWTLSTSSKKETVVKMIANPSLPRYWNTHQHRLVNGYCVWQVLVQWSSSLWALLPFVQDNFFIQELKQKMMKGTNTCDHVINHGMMVINVAVQREDKISFRVFSLKGGCERNWILNEKIPCTVLPFINIHRAHRSRLSRYWV